MKKTKIIKIRTGSHTTLSVEIYDDGEIVLATYCKGDYVPGSVHLLKPKGLNKLKKVLAAICK